MNHRTMTQVFRGVRSLAILDWPAWQVLVRKRVGSVDPWRVAAAGKLAQAIQSGKAPVLLSVAFPVLYKGKHIVHAINAGPTSKPEGIEALKNAGKAAQERRPGNLLRLLPDGEVSQYTARLSDAEGVGLPACPRAEFADESAHRLG